MVLFILYFLPLGAPHIVHTGDMETDQRGRFRRKRGQRRNGQVVEPAEVIQEEETTPEIAEPEDPAPKTEGVLMASTINVKHDPFKYTDEVKVCLCMI